MHARTALLAAILSGALAVAIVGADVAWGLESRLDTRTADGWETVDRQPVNDPYSRPFEPGFRCAEPEIRLVVTNDKPWGDTFDVRVTYYNASAKRDQLVLDETWSLESFASRTHTFRIPDAAFPTTNETDDRDKLPSGSVQVTAIVDELWLSTCVEREAVA